MRRCSTQGIIGVTMYELAADGIGVTEIITVAVGDGTVEQRSYTWPLWINVSALVVNISPIFVIGGFAVYQVVRNRSKGGTCLALVEPSAKWVPAAELDRLNAEEEKLRQSQCHRKELSSSTAATPIEDSPQGGDERGSARRRSPIKNEDGASMSYENGRPEGNTSD